MKLEAEAADALLNKISGWSCKRMSKDFEHPNMDMHKASEPPAFSPSFLLSLSQEGIYHMLVSMNAAFVSSLHFRKVPLNPRT